MKSKICIVSMLLSSIVFMPFSAVAQGSAKPVSIRIAYDSPSAPGNTYNELSVQFKSAVEGISGGNIKVEVFGDGQLGSERENFEAVQMGTLEMSAISNASIGAFAPAAIAIDLPFIFPNSKAAFVALNGPAGQAIVKSIEDKTGVKGLAFGEAGFRHMVTNRTAIKTEKDMQGLKIRVMQNEMYVTTYKLIGVNAVPMAWPEVLSGLQQGTIDGLDAPLQLVVSSGMDNICKNVSLTGHFLNALQLIINKKFYDGLSPQQQQWIAQAAKTAGEKQREVLSQYESKWIDQIKAKGLTVIPPEEINLSALESKIAEIYTSYAKQIGGTYVQDLKAAAQAAK
jgi:tripartite ATP-independent transporter DctP family solute receptor